MPTQSTAAMRGQTSYIWTSLSLDSNESPVTQRNRCSLFTFRTFTGVIRIVFISWWSTNRQRTTVNVRY